MSDNDIEFTDIPEVHHSDGESRPPTPAVVPPTPAVVPPVLVEHNDPPTTLPPPTASSRSTRDWLVALMTWEHWNWIETQPALIHSVMTTWHSDGFFLRTATEEQYQQAFGGCSTVSVCIFGYVQRLLAEENGEPPPKGAVRRTLDKGAKVAAIAGTAVVGCGVHGPDLVQEGVSPAWQGTVNATVQLGIVSSIAGFGYLLLQYGAPLAIRYIKAAIDKAR